MHNSEQNDRENKYQIAACLTIQQQKHSRVDQSLKLKKENLRFGRMGNPLWTMCFFKSQYVFWLELVLG